MNKKWQMSPLIAEEFKKQFPEIDSLMMQLLYNRGIKDQDSIDRFLTPDYGSDLRDSFLFKDMAKAVYRIIKAIDNGEKITIFGDYDADGVTSSVLLKKVLEAVCTYRGIPPTPPLRKGGIPPSPLTPLCERGESPLPSSIDVYIPHRGKEGYGLNNNALKYIKDNGTGLVISVDCGISNCEQADYAKSLGLDLIITDHHHPPPILPNAYAIINPKVATDNYPFKELAGVGVAFKLAQALIQENRRQKTDDNLLEAVAKWLLDLVAIGTVADMCPLVDENRVLVKYGLIVLNKTRNLGLKTLISEGGIAKTTDRSVRYGDKDKENINSWNISFQLGPRINSSGRLGHANTSYKLLVTENKEEAKKITELLVKTNATRQSLTEKAVKEAKEIIDAGQRDNLFLFVKGQWEPGIIGLIAGRLVDCYNRPVFVFTKIDGELVASGRSIPAFNLMEALESDVHHGKKPNTYLKRYGGHSQACGFSLKNENLYDEFIQSVLAVASKKLSKEDLIPILIIDKEIKLEDISWTLWDNLNMLEPFGQANKRPLFLFKNLYVVDVKLVGNIGKHIKLRLKAADESSAGFSKIISAIGFSLNDEENGYSWGKKLAVGGRVDIVGYVDVNEWNGNRELQIKVVDLCIKD